MVVYQLCLFLFMNNMLSLFIFCVIFIGGHESTAVLLLGTFELSNVIAIKKLFLNFYFYF